MIVPEESGLCSRIVSRRPAVAPHQKNDVVEPKIEVATPEQNVAPEAKAQARLSIKSGLKAGFEARCHHHCAPEAESIDSASLS
jgi:hypothetical protein